MRAWTTRCASGGGDKAAVPEVKFATIEEDLQGGTRSLGGASSEQFTFRSEDNSKRKSGWAGT